MTTASPIADLSYRNYDGPLQARALRWWIVALAGLRPLKKKAGFWAVAALVALPYLVTGIQLYMQAMQAALPGAEQTGQQHHYAVQFYQALQFDGLFIFIVALIAGAGVIAADNRANALLVYLSRPLTKADYLLGKWMGLFLALAGVSAVPALLLYIFCLLSLSSAGFWSEDRLLLLRVLGATLTPAAIHASLLVGFSAWSKTPRMAGAFYAAFYYVTGIVASIVWAILSKGHPERAQIYQKLSVGGVIDGLSQNIYKATIQTFRFRGQQGPVALSISPPPVWPLIALGLGLCIVGIVGARMRIRAVEVVRG